LTAIFSVFFIENRAAVADFDLRAPFWRHSVSREALWLPVLLDGLEPHRKFRQPETDWGAGHRGVDYLVGETETLVSPTASVVQFAGLVFGRPVVVLRHADGLSSEVEPACLAKDIAVGKSLKAGEPFANVCFGPKDGHCEGVCLHWGVRTATRGYLSPERFTGELTLSRLQPLGKV
ncbi:MAG: peptidoglycan DD-metalloendopeptidase family protein, partial [Actinobacteria bacterium]|nr:peptidoglycan DD-metalloendopeptidase family protein [Actinomycetota bacterium]